jgi:hypothetical protein
MDDKVKKALARLEEMGLKPGVMQTDGRLDILMEGPDGKSFAIPFDYDDVTYPSLPSIVPPSTRIPESLQKRNIATEVYKAAEQISGRKIIPDDVQTPEGFSLHSKRGLGKEFGMSEDELKSLLSSNDLSQREKRKGAFLKALEKSSEQIELPVPPDMSQEAMAYKAGKKELSNLLPESNKAQRNARSVLDNMMKEAFKTENPAKFVKDNAQKFASRVKSFAGPAVGLGAALTAGSASDAFAEVIPGGVDDIGKDSDKVLKDSQSRDVELTRDISKDDDTLTQTRLKALQRMLGK